MFNLFLLLVVFQFKHFLADYPFQTQYMLGKFKSGWEFLKPLTAHCLVHSALTFLIVWTYSDQVILALWLSAFDFFSHFLMDRFKAGSKWLGRFKSLSAKEFGEIKEWTLDRNEVGWLQVDKNYFKNHYLPKIKSNTYFWWSLGFDQMWHHLTHYAIIWVLVT